MRPRSPSLQQGDLPDRGDALPYGTDAELAGASTSVPGTAAPAERVAAAGQRGPCLVIAGMHRSGTSAMARVCSLLGAALPRQMLGLDRGNEAGHWEPSAIIALNNALLASAGTRWDDWRAVDFDALAPGEIEGFRGRLVETLAADYGRGLFVLKDPRVCRLLAVYLEALDEAGIGAKVIVPLRHPLAVAASLASRDRMTPQFAQLLWLRHVLDAERASRGRARTFVLYDALLADWPSVAARIGRELGLRWPREPDAAAAEIDAFLDGGLRHHSVDAESGSGLLPWAAEAHGTLLSLLGDAHDAAAMHVLDRIRAEFDSGAAVFGGAAFAEMTTRDERLRRALKRQTRIADQRAAEVDRLAAAEQANSAEIAALGDEVAAAARAPAESAEARRRAEDRAAAEEARSEALRVSLEEARQSLAAAERDAATADRRRLDEMARARRAAADAVHARGQLVAIRESRSWRALNLLARLAGRAPGGVPDYPKIVLRLVRSRVRRPADLAAALSKGFVLLRSSGFAGVASSLRAEGAAEAAVERPVPLRQNKVRNGIVFVSGESTKKPGHVYRIRRYAAAFRALGLEVATFDRASIRANLGTLATARLLVVWRAAWDEDFARLVAEARRQGVPVAYDIDDLMVAPELATAEHIDAIRSAGKDAGKVARHFASVRRAMTECTFSTATTHELAWHMRVKHGRQRRATFVMPNGFDAESYGRSRVAARARSRESDGLVRIGYAGGTRTHQRDFAICVDALAAVLRSEERARLVLFRDNSGDMLDLTEFPALAGLESQIEWRATVPLAELPAEIARFDINLAPLEVGNPFCESKSELKVFEAAIADVPTLASPTAPMRRAIANGETGVLAGDADGWRQGLAALIRDAGLRRAIGRAAHRAALYRFGPLRRVELAQSLLDHAEGGRAASRAFSHRIVDERQAGPGLDFSPRQIVFEHDAGRPSRVTVIVPLYNYADFVIDALDSVAAQSLVDLDLVVVDDCSTDPSLARSLDWAKRHADRFNRLTIARHSANAGLGASRNTAFDLADTLYVMALDADNVLRPACCERLYALAERHGAAFVYPAIQRFGQDMEVMGRRAYDPAHFIAGNGIDAMALISKEAWWRVGGYATHRMGWQDYDFWCRLVEAGLPGVHADALLADYRVHGNSMLRSATNGHGNKAELTRWMEQQHPWLSLREGRAGDRRPPRT